MFGNILAQLGCEGPLVRCSNPNVWTSLRTDGENRMVFAMNLLSAPMSAEITVQSRTGKKEQQFAISLRAMEVIGLPVID
jgi:hypothetical protein